MRVILLPVKDLSGVKQRLAPLLTLSERMDLVRAMLMDVTGALNMCKAADRIVVVTRDAWTKAYARAQSWDVLPEEKQISESDSVDRASRTLRGQGVRAVLRIPGDIPLVQAADLDSLLKTDANPPGAVLVPSRDLTGTNALLRTPPDVFPSRFGPNSCALHRQEARLAGAELKVIDNARISLDLDEPRDVVEFWKAGKGTLTFQVLEGLDVMSRAIVSDKKLNAVT